MRNLDTEKILLIFIVVFGGIIFYFLFLAREIPLPPPSPEIEKVAKFSSPEEFKAYLRETKLISYFPEDYLGIRRLKPLSPPFITPSPLIEIEEEAPTAPTPERISETTVQVIGIDEPDIVKTDGKEIYFSLKESFSPERFFEEQVILPKRVIETKIIKAFPPEKLSLEEKINKGGDLLLKENVLIIFSGREIYGLDVSEPKSPKEIWKIEFEEKGYLVGARLFKNKIYFVTKNKIDEVYPCPIKPLFLEEKPITIECNQIYHPIIKVPVDVTYNAFILEPNSGKIETKISFVGSSDLSIIYMSENGIYITYSFYGDLIKIYYDFLYEKCQDLIPTEIFEKLKKLKDYEISTQSKLTELRIILESYIETLSEDEKRKIENELENRKQKYLKERKRDLEKTGVVKIELKDFKVVATGEIPGNPLNQFSLDEYKNHLRIATTIGERFWLFGFWRVEESANDIYILDENLKIVGKIEDLGIGEKIYSARFIEDKGYLVTFREIDPFFVFDLSNPQKPELKGELKIPGYSSYLHPIEKDKILGIGKEEWKVKISLFAVSDPQKPKEVDKYILDESWSDILETHHAFLQDKKHQIFFLPTPRGGYIFSYQEDKLELKRVVSDILAKRAVYINDYLYIIGENKLVILDEFTWEKINEIEY